MQVKKTPINVPVCLRTNFKRAKNTYSKYFDKIEDSKQNLDMTDNNKNRQKKISNIFPTKYNQKDKYILIHSGLFLKIILFFL